MLNAEQKKAVECLGTPCMIIAGPGTGKTALLSEKIKYLIDKEKISPEQILSLTFTNKACEEMNLRVSNPHFHAYTFHSFALELLKEFYAEIPKLDKNFTIIDEASVLIYFLDNLEKFKFQSIKLENNLLGVSSELSSTILRLKDFGIKIPDLDKISTTEEALKKDILLAYTNYENFKKTKNLVDYADILILLRDFIKENSYFANQIKSRYKHILVDEFQDTNKLQLEIISLISDKNNITIVGDQKQSIYAFRGANYGNFAEFKQLFPNTNEIYLHENYRSSKQILEQLNVLIPRLASEKELLRPNIISEGEFKIIESDDEIAQTNFLIENIELLFKENSAPNINSAQNNSTNQIQTNKTKIAILTRTKVEAQKISKKLSENNIKHVLEGINNIFENNTIKKILSILRVVLSPKESNNELFYILSDIGLRNETLAKISRKSALKERSIYNVLVTEDKLTDFPDEEIYLQNFKNKLKYFTELKINELSIKKLVLEIIKYEKLYFKFLIDDNKESIYILNLFLNFIDTYQETYKVFDIEHFLRVCELSKKADLDIKAESDDSFVNLEVMTIHASKGKEFDYVFIPSLNKKKFPIQNKNSKFDIFLDQVLSQNSEKLNSAEELRLFFVAISRAKIGVYLSYVKKYSENKFPASSSEFLDYFKIKRELYSKKSISRVLSRELNSKEIFESETIKKIVQFLYDRDYALAKKEMENLKNCFGRENTLISYMKSDSGVSSHNATLANKNLVQSLGERVYSVSQLNTYKSCPKKYLYQYIYRIPVAPKHFFSFGTSVHTVLEEIVPIIGRESKEMVFSNAISRLHKAWISAGYETSSHEKEYFNKGLEIIKNFIEKQSELIEDKREVFKTEQSFNLVIEGKKIYGIIDRIDKVGENYEILDYKTSNSMDSPENLAQNIQLSVYALALKEDSALSINKFPSKIGLWYLVFDEIKSFNVDLKNLDLVKSQILKLISEIEAGNFVAMPSFFNCKFCDYCSICPNSRID